MNKKSIERSQATELMWLALDKDTNELYYYAPSLKELTEIVNSKGLKDKVVYHKNGYYMEVLPKWSRLHPDNRTKCVCKCGHEHYLEVPEDRDWRKAQGL